MNTLEITTAKLHAITEMAIAEHKIAINKQVEECIPEFLGVLADFAGKGIWAFHEISFNHMSEGESLLKSFREKYPLIEFEHVFEKLKGLGFNCITEKASEYSHSGDVRYITWKNPHEKKEAAKESDQTTTISANQGTR